MEQIVSKAYLQKSQLSGDALKIKVSQPWNLSKNHFFKICSKHIN